MAKKNRISRVYTKTGDKGETMLVDGQVVSKDSERVAAYGDIDELNSVLGITLAAKPSEPIQKVLTIIQNDLFVLGADLASKKNVEVPRIKKNKITWVEKAIDRYVKEVGPLKEFILPAGTLSGTSLHLARTVCRRAERSVVSLQKKEWINPNSLIYINRLSDLLFVLATYENKVHGEGEVFVNFKK